MAPKRKSGRPKKAEHEKAEYQRIAVFKHDYDRWKDKLDTQVGADGKPMQIVEGFSKMVDRELEVRVPKAKKVITPEAPDTPDFYQSLDNKIEPTPPTE